MVQMVLLKLKGCRPLAKENKTQIKNSANNQKKCIFTLLSHFLQTISAKMKPFLCDS